MKRIDPDRFWRVVSKILRGLFFIENGRVLPETSPRNFKVVSPGENPPPEFALLADEPERGQYPGVFDYKFRDFPDWNGLQLWAMLFWDSLIVLIWFQDPRDSISSED